MSLNFGVTSVGTLLCITDFIKRRSEVEFWSFSLLWLLAFTTACTIAQVVIAQNATLRDSTVL